MPTYEFRCQSCGRSFEELVFSQSEIADVVCPDCDSPNVVRKVSGFAAIGGARTASSGSACASGGG